MRIGTKGTKRSHYTRTQKKERGRDKVTKMYKSNCQLSQRINGKDSYLSQFLKCHLVVEVAGSTVLDCVVDFEVDHAPRTLRILALCSTNDFGHLNPPTADSIYGLSCFLTLGTSTSRQSDYLACPAFCHHYSFFFIFDVS